MNSSVPPLPPAPSDRPAVPRSRSERLAGIVVHSVSPTRPFHWMAKAGRDFIACRWVSAAHGLAVAVFGALLFALAHDRFWLLAGAFSGFLVVAPVLATGLYALSRALERGEKADMGVLVRTWTHWGKNRRSDPESYWCLVRFGALLALAGTGWVLTSAAFITLFSPVPIATPEDFVRHVVLSPNHFVFEGWLAMGGLLAAPVFASSVISMPLLLDRHVNALDAVLVSWRVVLTNPATMAVWALMLMIFTFCGFVTALLGMIAIVPMLGHASWHAYRDLVDASTIAERIAPQAEAAAAPEATQ